MTTLPRGFAALITTLIVSASLTSFAFEAGLSAYLARLMALEAEYEEQSRSHAYSCAQIALFELSADIGYRPPEEGDHIVLSPETTCTIASILKEGTLLTVLVHSEDSGFQTILELTLEEAPSVRPPFTIVSFRKI